MCDGESIGVEHLAEELSQEPLHAVIGVGARPLDLAGMERKALQALVEAHRGSRRELARKLGVSERTLYRKLKALEA